MNIISQVENIPNDVGTPQDRGIHHKTSIYQKWKMGIKVWIIIPKVGMYRKMFTNSVERKRNIIKYFPPVRYTIKFRTVMV